MPYGHCMCAYYTGKVFKENKLANICVRWESCCTSFCHYVVEI